MWVLKDCGAYIIGTVGIVLQSLLSYFFGVEPYPQRSKSEAGLVHDEPRGDGAEEPQSPKN